MFASAAVLVGLLIAGVTAEVVLRVAVGPPRTPGKPYFRDLDGHPVAIEGAVEEAMRRGLVEALPAHQTPRPRWRFAPGAHFFICFEESQRFAADWLDSRGCVEVRINSFGLRERESIRPDNKLVGERRILCLGDSFTFGWGLPEEACWVRLLENELRTTHGNVHTINCGLSGTLTVDECARGLETRFGAFQPDVVIASIYLNDLIPSHGLCIYQLPPPTSLLLVDYYRSVFGRDPLDLDPAIDWVELALGLGEQTGIDANVYGPDKPFSGMWSQGAPQRALVAMRNWCDAHNCRLAVVLWPFLQGLGPGASYPFRRLHDLVSSYCRAEQIAVLDLHPSLAHEHPADLWVTPFDKHANPRAQRDVLPAIAEFIRPLLLPQ